MSNKRHTDALLPGHEGPFFPSGLVHLGAALEMLHSCNAKILVKIASTISGYRDQFKPTTVDGYIWFWAMSFATEDGLAIIAIPYSQDWDASDGTKSDRSLAVYTLGNISDHGAAMVEQFTEAVLLEVVSS